MYNSEMGGDSLLVPAVAAALQEPPTRGPQQVASLEEFLHASQHLQHLSPGQLQQLVASAIGFTALPGTYIYTADSTNHSSSSSSSSQQVFLLVQGHVTLLQNPEPHCQQLCSTSSGATGSATAAHAEEDAACAACCSAPGANSLAATELDGAAATVNTPPTTATTAAAAAGAPGVGRSLGAWHVARTLHPGQLFGLGQELCAVSCQAHSAYVGLYRPKQAAATAMQVQAAEGNEGLQVGVDPCGGTQKQIACSNHSVSNDSSSSSSAQEALAIEDSSAPAAAADAGSDSSTTNDGTNRPSSQKLTHVAGAHNCGSMEPPAGSPPPAPCVLLSWDAGTFAAIAGPLIQAQQQKRAALLEGVASLQCLTQQQRALMAWRLHYKEYAPGDTVMKQGEPADSLYIIQYGQAGVLIEATETLQQQQLLTPRSQEQQQQQHDGRPVSARQEPDGAAGGASGTAAALAAGGEEYAHTTHLPAGEGARGSDPALLEHPESHHAHVRRARHLMQVAVLDEGQLMGDMALQAAAGGLRTATVAALSHLVAWQLTMEDVRQLLTPEDIQAVVDHTYSLRAAANAANATTTVRAKRGLRKRALPRNLQRQLMAGSTTLKVFLTKAGDNNTNLEAPSSSSGSGGVRSKSGSGDGAPGRSGHYPWSSPGALGAVSGQPPAAAAMPRPWASEPGGLLSSLFGGSATQTATNSSTGATHAQPGAFSQQTTAAAAVKFNIGTERAHELAATSAGSTSGSSPGAGTLASIIAATAGTSGNGQGGASDAAPASRPAPAQAAAAASSSQLGGSRSGAHTIVQSGKGRQLSKGGSSKGRLPPDDRAGTRAGCLQPNGSCSTSASGESSTGLLLGGSSWGQFSPGTGSALWSNSGSSGPSSGAGILLGTAMGAVPLDEGGAEVTRSPVQSLTDSRGGDLRACSGNPVDTAGIVVADCSAVVRTVAAYAQGAAATGAPRRLSKQQQAAPDQQLLVALQAAWHGTAKLPINQERPITYWGAFPLPVPRC